MSNTPTNLKYTKEHEWVLIEGDHASIGITEFAQSSLGDVVYVELPELNKELAQNDTFGVVESVKSVSDLYSPISGTVVEVNEDLDTSPESINKTPYESWIIKLKVTGSVSDSDLMDAEAYEKYCEEQ